MTEFEKKIFEKQPEPLTAEGIKILQLNVGYHCNMACKHCHIEASPSRTEAMGEKIIHSALEVAQNQSIKTIDLTGGAPELNPSFRYIIQEAKRLNLHVIVRSNLTVFFENGLGDLPEFYHEYNVEVIASLPHYMKDSVDRVRGNNTFQKSIMALKKLNDLGYGKDGINRLLHLVYNPTGAFLPSSQKELEEHYKQELLKNYGISFNKLYTFANMPIGRFREFLIQKDNLHTYMDKVKNAFNSETIKGLMCRYLVSVGWDGKLYDCDFNQILGLTVDKGCPQHIDDFDNSLLDRRKIVTGDHCFICTAGQGST